MYQTDLAEEQKKRNTTHLVIAGMTANLCCESTGRHAMEEGYDVTFISDAIGAAGVMEYQAAININFPLIANAVIKVQAGSEGGGYIFVPVGMIFKTDTYIPLDAVIKRTGTDVIINVPK